MFDDQRFQAASAAMAALIIRLRDEDKAYQGAEQIAQGAVLFADALIAELNKTKRDEG